MELVVKPGKYPTAEGIIEIPTALTLTVDPPERVEVHSEEQIISDEPTNTFTGGTFLELTRGPVDTFTRLPYAIIPESVRVHSAKIGGTLYQEGTDYILDHDWGGLSRVRSGAIPKGGKIYVDYAVSRERIDLVQISVEGEVAVKKGISAPVCPKVPELDKGWTAFSSIYITHRTSSIGADNIFPAPAPNDAWQVYIKTNGRSYLDRTRGLLRDGKPVTIICWGDSVTRGLSPSSNALCYVEQFRTALTKAYPQSMIKLLNAGISESCTDTRLDGFDEEVLSYNPDLITVEFINDVHRVDHISANWSKFIERARQKNPNVDFILLTPHYMIPAFNDNFEKAAALMRQAALENHVGLGDTANIWANLRSLGIPYETLLANGINHPNDLGHEFYAATLMKLMEPDM